MPLVSNQGTSTALQNGASTQGSVFGTTLVTQDDNSTVSGTVYADAFTVGQNAHYGAHAPGRSFVQLRRDVNFPNLPTTWESVQNNEFRPLAPGNYPNYSVKPGSGIVPMPGRYFFKSLAFETNSVLQSVGPAGGIYLYVEDSFTFRGIEQLGSSDHGLFVGVFPANYQQVNIETAFDGVVHVSRGRLVLEGPLPTGQRHQGQFFAPEIEVRAGAVVALKPFAPGLGEDADVCGWGRFENDSCNSDIACPGPSERKCKAGRCTCVVDPAAPVVQDGCSYPGTTSQNEEILVNKPGGTACNPAYGCVGFSTCDGLGHCICQGTVPGGMTECLTLNVPGGSPNVVRPVTDGEACTSYAGTCLVATTCAGGVCSCGVQPQAPAVNQDCVDDNKTHVPAFCANFECTVGTCASDNTCVCPSAPAMTSGHPIRIGTQNVHGLGFPASSRSLAGCKDMDFFCEASLTGPKIKASNYDVIAINEGFHEQYKEGLFRQLSGPPDHDFPYGVYGMDSSSGGFELNSGLMLFSKWPFDTNRADELCFDRSGLWDDEDVDLIGMGGYPMTPAVYFEPYTTGFGPDYYAAKGLGYARVLAPHGRILNVFFSHLQANDKSFWRYALDWIPDWTGVGLVSDALLNLFLPDDTPYSKFATATTYRAEQLDRANEIIDCVRQNHQGSDEVFVLLGDLNVTGDLSNPVGTSSFQDNPVETRDEWDATFNWNNHLPRVSATILQDTWAYSMTPSCVVDAGTEPPESCKVIGNDPSKPTSMQGGPVSFDRGATQALNAAGEERLDYILLNRDSAAINTFDVQHVSRAFNLLNGSVGPSAFIRNPDNVVHGLDPISDHYGVNAEIDDVAEGMNPAKAFVPTFIRSEQARISSRFEYPTAVHWYKIEEPGDYAFSVNSRDQKISGNVYGPDNGVSLYVFENTELSIPLAPYQGEIVDVPPSVMPVGGTDEHRQPAFEIPGFRQAKFRPSSFPLWVKVFVSDPLKLPKSGRYLFLAKRMTCGSKDEACGLLPYGTVLGDETPDPVFGTPTPKVAPKLEKYQLGSRTGEAWFSFRVERPDWAGGQEVRLFAGEPESSPTIDSVQVASEETGAVLTHITFTPSVHMIGGQSWKVWMHQGVYGGALEDDPAIKGSIQGRKYYLQVLRNPSTVATNTLVTAGWQTNLTWLFGPAMGGEASCQIRVEDTQEVGADEIWLKLWAGVYDPATTSWKARSYWPLGSNLVHEAQDGVEFDNSFNEVESHDWTERFFGKIGSNHPDDTPFARIPAIGFGKTLGLELWEDDNNSDETTSVLFNVGEFPLQSTTIISRDKTAVFDNLIDDGEYVVTACNFSHYLNPARCETNAECRVPLRCKVGTCR